MGQIFKAFGVAALMLGMANVATAANTATSAEVAKPADELQSLKDRIHKGVEKLNHRDFAGASADLHAIVADANFARLPDVVQYGVHYVLALIDGQLGKNDEAYAHLQAGASASPESIDADYWMLTRYLAVAMGKDETAIDAMINVARVFPDALPKLDVRLIYDTDLQARALPDKGVRRQRLLEALWEANYQPSNAFNRLDALWFGLFELRLMAGKTDSAREVLARLESPGMVIKMRSDRRYRDYISDLPEHGDYQKAFDLSLERARLLMMTYPRKLQGVQDLAYSLQSANQLTEALNLIDEALAKIAAAPKGKPAFDDLDENQNWVLDTRSRILAKLGRWREVEAAKIKARDVAMAQNFDVVSQKINLGDFYNTQGRPAEALKEVKDVDKNSSAYGVMVAQSVRVCAYAQLNDQANLALSLNYMRAHAKDGYGPFLAALLCADDMEGLSAIITRRLDDPQTRNDMLVELQTYLSNPNAAPYDKVLSARYDAMRNRPEIAALIAKYGFIESYPIFSDN